MKVYLYQAENTMTCLTITACNQLQLKPLACNGKSTVPYLNCLAKILVDMLGNPGSNSGSTSACPCLYSEEILLTYWPVCKFDLISTIPSVLISVAACHLPLFNE